jgi:membrane fusion protein (multidrug efflux system)
MFVAKISGELSIVAKAGTLVKKNDEIAKLDNEELQKTYEVAQNAVTIAKEQYERSLALQKNNTTSKQSTEDKRVSHITAEKQAYAAKIELDKTTFKAPFDGIVGVFKFRDGGQVNPGDAIVSVYNSNQAIITFDIPENDIQYVDVGQKVLINEKEYKLTELQKMIDPVTHMAPAQLDYDCKDKNCIYGSHIFVDLVVQHKNDALTIPKSAVFFDNGQAMIYCVSDQNKAILTPISLGIESNERYEVVKGLKEGDKVITLGITRLYPDVDVVIAQAQTSEKKES